jgi:hypothetical protein
MEVTPGLLAGAEPDAHQFMSQFVYGRGDRMEVNSDDIVSTLKLGPHAWVGEVLDILQTVSCSKGE